MILDNFFLKLNYDLDWEKLKPIAKLQVEIPEQDNLANKSQSSYLNLHNKTINLVELQPYYTWLLEKVKEYAFVELKYPPSTNISLQNAWFQQYFSGGYVTAHNHPDSIFTTVLYLEIPTDSSFIMLKDPYYDHKLKYSKDGSDEWLWQTLKVKESDLFIFEGGVVHKTNPNTTNNDKWCLVTNIGINYKKSII